MQLYNQLIFCFVFSVCLQFHPITKNVVFALELTSIRQSQCPTSRNTSRDKPNDLLQNSATDHGKCINYNIYFKKSDKTPGLSSSIKESSHRKFVEELIVESPDECILIFDLSSSLFSETLLNVNRKSSTKTIVNFSYSGNIELLARFLHQLQQNEANCRFLDIVLTDESVGTEQLYQVIYLIRNYHYLEPINIVTSRFLPLIYERAISDRIYNIFMLSPITDTRMPGYKMTELCLFCKFQESFARTINFWYSIKGFRHPLMFPSSFKGSFHSSIVNVGIGIEYIPNRYPSEETACNGCECSILRDVQDTLQFTAEYVQLNPPEEWMMPTKNGSYAGLVGQLMKHEADIAGLPVDHASTGIHKYVANTDPIYQSIIVFLSSKPVPATQIFSLFRPFEWRVWLSIVLSVVVCGFTWFVLERISSRWVEGTRNLDNCMFSTIRIIFWEAVKVTRLQESSKFVVGVWMLTSFVIIASYSGALMSHLMTPIYINKPIDSVEDLVESTVSWFVPFGLPLNEIIGDRKDVQSRYSEADFLHGMDKIYEFPGEYAFLSAEEDFLSQINLFYIDEAGDHKFHIGKDPLTWLPIVWLTRKTCPYLEDINRVIRHAHAGGLFNLYMQKEYKKYAAEGKERARKLKRPLYIDQTLQKISLDHIFGGLLVMIVGMGLGIISFFIELAIFKIREQKM